MTFKVSGNMIEPSFMIIQDNLWGTRRSTDQPPGTYGFQRVWNENRGQCYIAESENPDMNKRMLYAWHFPYIQDCIVYGDSVVFART